VTRSNICQTSRPDASDNHKKDPMPNAEPNYIEFSDPRLVAIYNTVCPLDGYEKFYKVYGFWDWSLATPESPEFIFVARRE
jgi:hypothetical protein